MGHAGFQIKTKSKVIYIDPRYMKTLKERVGEFFENPDEADLILFTHHHHADHCYPA
ncbi:MAG TPA: MBL fold metallo-hydrolase [Anaerolineae bacterium]|nr:MBL fold metallo-hydrolase [Anaerolineae bacterium]